MRIIHAIVILLFAGSVSAQEFVLEREDDRYTLRAKAVPNPALQLNTDDAIEPGTGILIPPMRLAP